MMWKRKAVIDAAECPISDDVRPATEEEKMQVVLDWDRLDKEKTKVQEEVDAWVDGCPLDGESLPRGTTFTFLGICFVVVSVEVRRGRPRKWKELISSGGREYYSALTFGASFRCAYTNGTSVEERYFDEDEIELLLEACHFKLPEEKG